MLFRSRSKRAPFLNVHFRPLHVGSNPEMQPAKKTNEKKVYVRGYVEREEGCREIIESVWDPFSYDMGLTITDKLRRC